MGDIGYSSAENQVEKLKSQNLIIEDDRVAADYLSLYGYSNLIKSYRDPYVLIDRGTLRYRDSVSFVQIASLYLLDKNLRNAMMAAMQDLEESIKEAVADVVASSFGTHQDQYLVFRHYQNKRKRKERFSLRAILETMNRTLDTDKDPICHYRTVHGIVPPWILFKSLYFSTIINFIDQLKKPQQIMLAQRIYGNETPSLSDQQRVMLMMDTLFIASEYRNLAAHGGRIYNHHCQYHLRESEIFPNQDPFSGGFDQILYLLGLMKYKSPQLRLHGALHEELNRHCGMFPEDVTYLAQILHVNITQHNYVYISGDSKIYHRNPHCSGMQNAREIDSDSDELISYTPCKRCCR